jgi:hypothetical protein
MAKFHGAIGYGESVEIADGVWDDVVTEREYYGDVIRNSITLQNGQTVNNDLTVGNSISIIADAYAGERFFAIRYVEWAGALWTVSDITVERPRLLLRLGGVYNGPKASTSGSA